MMTMLKILEATFHQLRLKIADYAPFLVPKKRGSIQYYLLAIVLMGLALWLRLKIAPVNAGLQYVTFFPAVALAAVAGGLRPGLFATAIGLFLATFIFTTPYYSFSVEVLRTSFMSNMVFLMDGIVVSFSIEVMHRYRQKYAQELQHSLEAHSALKGSTQYLKRILDNLFAYVALLDVNGVVQEINKAPLEQGGYRREDVIGQYFYDVPWWSYDKQVRSQLMEAIEAARQGRTVRYDVAVKMGENRVPIDFQISPVSDESGRIVGLLATGVDISARKQAEAISRRHKVVIDTARDGFWVADLEGHLLEANQAYADMSGYSIGELTGMHTNQLEAIEAPEEVTAHIAKIFAQGYDLFESRHRHKDGHEFDVEVSVNYMAETQLIFAFFRDISERKQIEERLRQAKQLTDSIIENIPAMVFMKRASDLRFELFNHTGEALLGYPASDFIGKNDHDFFPAEQADFFTSEDRKVLASPGVLEIPEEAIKTASGETRYLHTRKVALRDQVGRPVHLLGMSIDITERKKAEEALRVAAATFETNEAIMITDAEARIIRVNRAFEKITGYSEQEVIGKNPSILKSGRHEAHFYADMWQALLNEGTWSGEVWDRNKSGNIYPKQSTISAVKNAKGETTQYVSIFSDISERKKAEEDIRNLAFYDALTGLPNRRLLLDRLGLALSVSERNQQYGALLFLDLDKFKTLNDTLGHEYGDMLLIEVARRLKYCVREVDTVARLGGDEFVVLIENICADSGSTLQNVAQIAEKIRAVLATPYQLKGNIHHSSPSIGACLFFGNHDSASELIKRADMAMYQAKDSGRNRVRFFDPHMQESVETRAALESDLRQAIADRQFQLYYQIQIDHDRRPVGAEALIRWMHPKRGMVPPAEFIPIAEESSLILDIGHWVLDAACRQIAAWSHDEQTRHLALAINISGQEFKQPEFVERVAAMIQKHNIDPTCLKLELTESVALENIDAVVAKMLALRETLGVTLSLDDFGTGYSSLSYLKRLPLDQIKIDQSFVRGSIADSNNAVMVKAIIDMAQNFGLNVIAEGVETEAQWSFLKENGCMVYQGYLFSQPVSLEEFEARLKRGDPF
ncbi:MAG: PAS domain S-box protein [Betaproteobacteria bacterium]|nr:PAS domain S-box protein [Betaproteobacteria bacterium]